MLEYLERLAALVGPSGWESAVAELIIALGTDYGQVQQDALGNVVIHKPGPGKKILLAAHMDTTGVVVTYPEKDGYLRIAALGELPAAMLLGQQVQFCNGTLGVIAAEAGAKATELSLSQLYLDPCGQTVQVGEAAAFCGKPQQLGNLLLGPALGSRLGCAILLEVLRQSQDSPNDLYFAFTVQQAVGARGIVPAAYLAQAQLGLVVDAVAAGDIPGSAGAAPALHKGPILQLMDGAAISHRAANDWVSRAAAAQGLPLQRHVSTQGSGDAAGLLSAMGGMPVTQVGYGVRNLHTPHEIASWEDAQQCVRLLTAAIREYQE